jgi:hypothetical protein
MMNSKWFGMDAPASWADLLVGTVKVAVVAFVILQMKEWFDAGSFDTAGTAFDALMIAAGIFVVNVILMHTTRST